MTPIANEYDQLLVQALTSVANPVMITTVSGTIVWANPAFCKLYGYSSTALVGQTPAMLQSGQQDDNFYAALWETILRGDSWQGELVNCRHDGSLFTVEQTISPLVDDAGHVSHFVTIQRDITDAKCEVEHQQYLAQHDTLTGLANRAFFEQALQSTIGLSADQPCIHALLFIDLDKFKPVNDQNGHLVGDALLVAVAQRLRAAMRKSDLVARFGGDEFVVLRKNLRDPSGADALALTLVKSLSRPFSVGNQLVSIGASIGISLWPRDGGGGADSLFQAADAAMYFAKRAGGNTWYRPGGRGLSVT
jgi:diguanylate cyclase